MSGRPKNAVEIEHMREGGKILTGIMDELSKMVAPGVKPAELSAHARRLITKHKVRSALLGFEKYPDVICISLNEAVVHGIPGNDPIKTGDIVKIDLAIEHRNMIVDRAVSVVAGNSSPEVRKLLEGTERALMAGIDAISGDGTRVGDISSAIENVLRKYRLGIVRDLVGHGVGYSVHENPNIPNYGSSGTGPKLSAGMTLAIEPMATLGGWEVGLRSDGWTVVTRDGSLAAHFEHTVLVTEQSAEILTVP